MTVKLYENSNKKYCHKFQTLLLLLLSKRVEHFELLEWPLMVKFHSFVAAAIKSTNEANKAGSTCR
jgi:hypothetical protein